MGFIEENLAKLCRETVGESFYLKAFEQVELPRYRSEDYQRTDICKMLDNTWQVAEAPLRTNFAEIELPQGLSFVTLDEFPKELLPKQVSSDSISLLAQALKPNASVLYLAKGVKTKDTLDVDTILDFAEETLVAQNLYIVLDEGAELSLIRRNHSKGAVRSLHLDHIFIYASKNAKLDLTEIENTNDLTERISQTNVYQMEGSDVNIKNFSLRSARTRNNYSCHLIGEGANLNLGGLVLNDGKNHVDNFSYIAHEVPNCTSNELFKYILQDNSYGVFTGRILVAVDAQKTLAYQNNRNLLLSSSARMQAKPQLEIYADDVKCSHGMTTGQLDADALFYMRQRGIPLVEAKRLLSIAFADDIVKMLPNETLQERVLNIISEQLS